MTKRVDGPWRSAAFAAAALVAAALCWLAFRALDGRESPSAPSAQSTAAKGTMAPAPTSAPRPPPSATFVVLGRPGAPGSGAAPTTVGSGGKRRLLASDPDPVPAVNYPGVASSTFDPFDPGSRDPVRTLASFGTIRVGVPASAEVRDEAQVKAILGELAKELDGKEKGRADSYESRAHEYQQLLGGYGEKLRPYMNGAFAFHGEGWILFQPVAAGTAGGAGVDHANP
jgi:hypothetical protein